MLSVGNSGIFFFFFSRSQSHLNVCSVCMCLLWPYPNFVFFFLIQTFEGCDIPLGNICLQRKSQQSHIFWITSFKKMPRAIFFFSVALGNVGYVKNKTCSTFFGRSLKTFSVKKKESGFLLVCVWVHVFKRVIPTYLQMFSPWASLIAHLVKNPPAMQETPDQFLGWEDPLQKG